MRYLLLVLLALVVLSGSAFAADAFSLTDNFEKDAGIAVPPDPSVILQGGDDCSDYIELSGNLPITDNGTTSGYTNNYGPFGGEPACWQGSFFSSDCAAADVTYKYTASATADYTFSLCGSGYDTCLLLYHFTCPDEPTEADLICGNDDSDCGLQSELVDIPLSAGDEVLIVVDGYSSSNGNYTLTITSTEPAMGACCVDMECVGNFTELECGDLGGMFYAGQDCASFTCPEPTCLEQAPNQSNGIFSDTDCDLCGSGVQVLAENFVLAGEIPINALTFFGGYYPGDNSIDPDCFTVIFREDGGGVPGAEIAREDCLPADDKLDTGIDLFGVSEYMYTINTDITLPGGTYYVEIYNNTSGNGDSWFWEVGDFDSQNGVMGSAWTPNMPEEPWNYDSGTDMALMISCGGSSDETLVYSENFDSGMGAWSGGWATTGSDYVSPPNSLTDSPSGNYPDNNTNTVEMTSDIDLSGFFGASLEFQTKFELEQGFDYVYLYISTNGGTNWSLIETFNGEGQDDYTWHGYTRDLGGYVGQSVRFRFSLVSDAGYNVDGMYIDDFMVYGLNTDTSPPLIMHEPPDDMTAIPGDFIAEATITDVSGVQAAWITYAVDGGDDEIANPDSTDGDNYYFTIPTVPAGSHVEYYITANDTENNEGSTAVYHYVSGTMIVYDDGDPEYIYQYAAGNKIATRFTPSESATLVTGVLRLYTDINRPIDTVDVQVWANGSNNNPGQALIDPYAVWPMSTLDDPQGWTYVDFRGMGITVDGDFHLGYTQRSEWPVILGDSPAVTGRSNVYSGGSWAPATADFHIRAVVDYTQTGIGDNGNQVPREFSLKQNYPNPFNANTVIEYNIKNAGDVELNVYNVLGQKVATLASGHHEAGTYSITWNASDVPSGVYFAKIESGSTSESVKMVLLK